MKRSLKAKLSLSYALLALLLVAAVSLVSNLFLQRQFQKYVKGQLEQRVEETVSHIAQQFDSQTQSFDVGALSSLGINALEQGLILRIRGADGSILWDAQEHNSGLCSDMLSHMAYNMQCQYGDFKGSYQERSYPVMVNGLEVGSVNIGYYGPFYLTDSDVAFIGALNRSLVYIGLSSLLMAVLLGVFMARRISRPIAQAVDATQSIAKGNYREKIRESSNTRELDTLITSVNSLSSALLDQDTLRKRLTADVAHELRTPLAALLASIEAMMDGVLQADMEHLESCHEEILRLSRLVGDLERLAQLENERTKLEKTEFDLKELAEKAALGFEPERLKKGIGLSVHGVPQTIVADRDKMRQVLNNLLSNSLKYTPEGGAIVVDIENGDDFAVISVKDNGIGIAQEHLPFIFERFYRADPSRNKGTGGAGIGLAIVKAIVEMHGGSIYVKSTIGQGTEFTIKLPNGN